MKIFRPARPRIKKPFRTIHLLSKPAVTSRGEKWFRERGAADPFVLMLLFMIDSFVRDFDYDLTRFGPLPGRNCPERFFLIYGSEISRR